jgi:tetratricopeptide (TPR) repeat protein
MPKYCTQCGFEVVKNFKYCPECGAEIITSDKENVTGGVQTNLRNSITTENANIIICDNCGDENSSDENVCSGCGIKLKGIRTKGKVKASKDEITQPKKLSLQQKSKSSKKKTKADQKIKIRKEEKELDPKKIYLIAAVIGIFILVILYSSGVFDSNVATTSSFSTGNDQSSNSGVDLSNIQKINELEEKLSTNPDDTNTLIQLANLKFDSGFFDKAIPLYQRYLKIIPSNSDARIDMGVCYFNIGDYDTAILEMKKALEFEPGHQIGHLNLGVVNLTAGNVDEAKNWFQKAIELGPDTDVGKRAKDLLNLHN